MFSTLATGTSMAFLALVAAQDAVDAQDAVVCATTRPRSMLLALELSLVVSRCNVPLGASRMGLAS
eukprot:SAG31_NODE_13842_length_843_cov_1.010753_1_plen_65_part_10